MKIFGRKIEGPNEEIIAIPRAGGDIIFKAVAVMNYDKFNELVPKPTPPKIRKKNDLVDDYKNPSYRLSVDQYDKRKYYFIILESLKATPGLEWETVDYNDPNTWNNFEKELETSGFCDREIQHIVTGVMLANSFNETKIEEARQRFLQLQEEQRLRGLSPTGEQNGTPSGELANASA